jgi:hypothetical protein
MLAALEKIIKDNRRQRLILGKAGKRNATIAIDIYCSATGISREVLHERKRVANRWAALSGVSPLLLFAFTDVAERIMYVCSLLYSFTL